MDVAVLFSHLAETHVYLPTPFVSGGILERLLLLNVIIIIILIVAITVVVIIQCAREVMR